jgi:hypothetical protein
MSSAMGKWYEIGIITHSVSVKPSKNLSIFDKTGDGVQFNGFGRYGYEAGWRFQKVEIQPKSNIRTVFRRAKSPEKAKKCVKKLGSILFCHKVSEEFHYKKIEYLNLKQVPMTVSLARDDEFVLNAQGELTPTMNATRHELEKKYEITIEFGK